MTSVPIRQSCGQGAVADGGEQQKCVFVIIDCLVYYHIISCYIILCYTILYYSIVQDSTCFHAMCEYEQPKRMLI